MEQSPLLRLPAEIRNRIYELALRTTNINPRLDSRNGDPPLTRTSRNIRKECLLLYYSLDHCAFLLNIGKDGLQPLINTLRLEQVQKKLKAIVQTPKQAGPKLIIEHEGFHITASGGRTSATDDEFKYRLELLRSLAGLGFKARDVEIFIYGTHVNGAWDCLRDDEEDDNPTCGQPDRRHAAIWWEEN